MSDIKKYIREACGWMEELQKQDGNEAETRRRIERMLERICGYDAFKHLSREDSVKGAGETEHADFTIRAKPDKISLVLEIKRVNIDLAKKHLNQAEQYATKLGCEWVVISNGRQWQLHHWDPSPPAEMQLVESWDVIHDAPDQLAKKFDLISFQSVRRGALDKLWRKEKSLTPRALISGLVSEPALNCLRTVLRKEAGHRPNPEDIVSAMRKIFNDNALRVMDDIKICLPSADKPKHQTRRAKNDVAETETPPQENPPSALSDN